VYAEHKLKPVMLELAFNLESFNPAFTAVLLKVDAQCMTELNRMELVVFGTHNRTRGLIEQWWHRSRAPSA
jgi:hypothetical protein